MPLHVVPPSPPEEVVAIATFLDPVLTPLGFASGQVGVHGRGGQVIFCRGFVDAADGGCVDLVIDVALSTEWRIADVRYWGFPSERWHLEFLRDAALPEQIGRLSETLPAVLSSKHHADDE